VGMTGSTESERQRRRGATSTRHGMPQRSSPATTHHDTILGGTEGMVVVGTVIAATFLAIQPHGGRTMEEDLLHLLSQLLPLPAHWQANSRLRVGTLSGVGPHGGRGSVAPWR
jgi:hypothetical protein